MPRGRSQLGGRSNRSVRAGIERASVSNRGKVTRTKTVQTFNRTPNVQFGGMKPRQPRKVVTRTVIHNRTGRSRGSVRVITGRNAVLSRHRTAIFVSRSGGPPSQRTMIAGAYAGNSFNPRTRAHYKTVVSSAGYRRSRIASSITKVPTYKQRRVRTRRDSRGRFAGSYAG